MGVFESYFTKSSLTSPRHWVDSSITNKSQFFSTSVFFCDDFFWGPPNLQTALGVSNNPKWHRAVVDERITVDISHYSPGLCFQSCHLSSRAEPRSWGGSWHASPKAAWRSLQHKTWWIVRLGWTQEPGVGTQVPTIDLYQERNTTIFQNICL